MLRISAPAKLNLHLHVTGKREDGYHLLDSLVCFADTSDTLIFEPSSNFQFEIEGPFASKLTNADKLASRESGNSIVRAAWLFADNFSKNLNLKITLQKNLPPGGGIGGGTADAAACLWGLREFWALKISDAQLLSLATQIGSDVPVSLKSAPAIMQGVGEILHPAPDMPEIPFIMIWPNQHTPTPAVFKNLHLDGFSPLATFKASYETVQALISDLTLHTRNDLEKSALQLFPVIETALTGLRKNKDCLFARMSGSGSTVFGFFDREEQAHEAAEKLQKEHPDWWIHSGWLNRVTRY